MESIGTFERVAPIARSPLDASRGRRKKRCNSTHPPSSHSPNVGFPQTIRK